MSRELSLVIEALNLLESNSISCSSAVIKAAVKVQVKDRKTIVKIRSFVRNLLDKKNFIDRILNLVLAPASLEELNLRNRSFLRIFVFETKVNLKSLEEAAKIAEIARSVLGWRRLMQVEEYLGKILSLDANKVLSSTHHWDRISIQTGYPEWFVKYCIRLIGMREGVNLLNYSSLLPRYVGINTLRGNEAETLREMTRSNIVLDKVEHIPYLYRVVQRRKLLAGLTNYERSLFLFQDKASCFAVILSDPKPKHIVLHGGVQSVAHTVYLAQLMKNRGTIFVDSSTRKTKTLKSRVKRMGVDIVRTIERGETKNMTFAKKADRVLIRPNCSRTGVLWRNPSLKIRTNHDRVTSAASAQWKLLNKYASFVKDGGNLVYWTKSITIEENEMLIERFLKLHPEFILMHTRPRIGVSAFRGQIENQRFYPHLHGVDGSFFAKLLKRT